jgi:hypothetical protein
MYKEKIVDSITGKEIIRDYTAEQVAEVEAAQVEASARVAEAEARATARASALAKLAALGLSADEIAAL